MAIEIPGDELHDGPWQITHPLLKLALKYGVVDGSPWAGDQNWSVEFDRYALGRGPETGPPRLVDAAVTALMNSGIRAGGLSGLAGWLADPLVKADSERLARSLSRLRGLQDADQTEVEEVVAFADSAIESAKWIGPAVTYKWLAAWAPAHVPMLDSLVVRALTGGQPGPDRNHRNALPRFKDLAVRSHDHLVLLGRQLHALLEGRLPAPVPPVRVLDSLLWFDWWLDSRHDDGQFKPWIRKGGKRALEYPITAKARRAEEELLARLELPDRAAAPAE